MKFIRIEDIPGRVPPKHYAMLGRTIADESMGVKDFRTEYITVTSIPKDWDAGDSLNQNLWEFSVIFCHMICRTGKAFTSSKVHSMKEGGHS